MENYNNRHNRQHNKRNSNNTRHYERLYFDAINYGNNISRHLTPPQFIAGDTCVRMFFVRFELFRNSFEQNWNDDLSINILCNLLCDKTLLVILNFPPAVQNSYERTKRYLITYFASGETNDMLWHELNSRQLLIFSMSYWSLIKFYRFLDLY